MLLALPTITAVRAGSADAGRGADFSSQPARTERVRAPSAPSLDDYREANSIAGDGDEREGARESLAQGRASVALTSVVTLRRLCAKKRLEKQSSVAP